MLAVDERAARDDLRMIDDASMVLIAPTGTPAGHQDRFPLLVAPWSETLLQRRR